ncbi:MAG TPA: hypothetical protein VG889_17435 [Rhizomicrobium sp.]|nr:hypothetical protein [Rhizomicrobium sp.]
MKPAIAAALAVSLSGPAVAQDLPGWCRYDLLDVPRSAPKFEDYAVPREIVRHPAAPRLAGNRDARMFRTNLRNAVKDAAHDGPNFAGHYTIAGWGCGTGCMNWAVIDLKTGTVTFDERMRALQNARVSFARDDAVQAYARRHRATADFGVLTYSATSNLLITTGAPNENESRDGAAFWRWTGKRFARVAFYPAIKLCRKPKD